MPPPATAARQLADWLATQSQTGAFHIGISSDLVYIHHVPLASRSACISTWLHHHSFCPSPIFALSLYLFLWKVLWISPMDTTPTRGSFPCLPDSLPLSAPHPWLRMMPDNLMWWFLWQSPPQVFVAISPQVNIATSICGDLAQGQAKTRSAMSCLPYCNMRHCIIVRIE